VKGAEEASGGAKRVANKDPPSDDPAELDAAAAQLSAARGRLGQHTAPLARAWTLLAYCGEAGGADYGSGGVQGRALSELQTRAGAVRDGLAGADAALAARRAALAGLLRARAELEPGDVGFRAARTIAVVNNFRITGKQSLQDAGEPLARLALEATPSNNKTSFAVEGYDVEGAPADSAAVANKRALDALMAKQGLAGLADGVRELMASHLLVRADSKPGAVQMLLRDYGTHPGLLKMFVTLCAARCAAVLPFHSGALVQPYQQNPDPNKAAEARCPLGLPCQTRKDCMRLPLPLAAAGTYTLVEPLPAGAKSLPGTLLRGGKRKQVLKEQGAIQAAPFCRLGAEWVRLVPSTAADGAFILERALLGTEACEHPAGTALVPHVMVPEGSKGTTETLALVLVGMVGQDEAVHQAFGWMQSKDSATRGARERLYSWLAALARACAAGSGATDASAADRQRSAAGSGAGPGEHRAVCKYMLTHLEALLRVAGAELADAYPKQVAKIAAALQKAPEVAGALPHLPDDARESLKAMLVLLATAGTDASVSEQLRQRQAASEEEGGAFENRVDIPPSSY